MSGRDPLPGVREALDALEIALLAMSEGEASPREVLRQVFAVNDRVGKAARRDAGLKPILVEVQRAVNLVTVEVKRWRPAEAMIALGDARKIVSERIYRKKDA